MTRDEILTAIKSGADLRGADLHGADLSNACLSGADLNSADLRSANLRGAFGTICAGYDPRGFRFTGHAIANGELRILAGCRWFTMREAVEHWQSNGDALARVDVILFWARKEKLLTCLAPLEAVR